MAIMAAPSFEGIDYHAANRQGGTIFIPIFGTFLHSRRQQVQRGSAFFISFSPFLFVILDRNHESPPCGHSPPDRRSRSADAKKFADRIQL